MSEEYERWWTTEEATWNLLLMLQMICSSKFSNMLKVMLWRQHWRVRLLKNCTNSLLLTKSIRLMDREKWICPKNAWSVDLKRSSQCSHHGLEVIQELQPNSKQERESLTQEHRRTGTWIRKPWSTRRVRLWIHRTNLFNPWIHKGVCLNPQILKHTQHEEHSERESRALKMR